MSVVLITEQTGGRWHAMTWEALTAAQRLATDLGSPLTAVVVGAGAAGVAPELAAKKVDRVLTVEHDLLAQYTADGYTAALEQALGGVDAKVVLLPNTYEVRDYAPKLAVRMNAPLISDVVGFRVGDGRTVFVRQLFQGKMNADVTASGGGLVFASVQSGSFRGDQAQAGDSPAPVDSVSVEIAADAVRVQPRERYQESAGGVDLTAAERIVSVGRGIKEPDNIPLAEKLATLLKAELAASRPICDNGWLPLERQVGSSGQTVSPKLYLALGISGAIQHMVGMKGAQTIVAINKDESAPIFEIADYGIVGDIFEVVPALIAELEKE